MSSAPGLVLAAAGVGLGHAVLPDHWAPLAVMARAERLGLRRVARLAALAGTAHVVVSIGLGAVLLAVGLGVRRHFEDAQNTIVGTLLILTGLAFVLLEAIGRGHGHGHDHRHDDDRQHDHRPHDHGHAPGSGGMPRGSRLPTAARFAIPFGAAASPDLTILPVFAAAAVAGPAPAALSLVAFAAATILTVTGLTLAAALTGFALRWAWLDRFGNLLTAATLLLIGGLVLTGTI